MIVLQLQRRHKGARDEHASFEGSARVRDEDVEELVHGGIHGPKCITGPIHWQGASTVPPVTPFSPLGKPQEHVSQERMQEILSKNSSKATQSPQEKSALKLEWDAAVFTNEEKSTGYLLSACGRYRIDKAGRTYTSWRRATVRDHLNLRLGIRDTIDAAKELCEGDCL